MSSPFGHNLLPPPPKTFKNLSPIWCNNEDSRHFPSYKLDGKKARKMYSNANQTQFLHHSKFDLTHKMLGKNLETKCKVALYTW